MVIEEMAESDHTETLHIKKNSKSSSNMIIFTISPNSSAYIKVLFS